MDSLEQSAWRALKNAGIPRNIEIPGNLISHKRILVTGAGGSIGTALVQSIAPHNPAQILLLEASEQALYNIDRETAAPHLPILANVCDIPTVEAVFEQHCPHIVFHAAAYKHLPLMELHPFAAMQNNAVATFHLTQTAIRHQTEQLILVSTDKAVDPASIMGASKRIAELVALALHSPVTQIKAVRLGNVYASQGSVVQLFCEQIRQGKPLTVTHPDATRFLITIEQTSALLLHALSEQYSSAVLVPELGNAIRIADVAQALIECSGSSSPIVYSGLRPGEKLHEQFLSASESFLDGAESPLRSIRTSTITSKQAKEAIHALEFAIQGRNLNDLLAAIRQIVPAYTPSAAILAQSALIDQPV